MDDDEKQIIIIKMDSSNKYVLAKNYVPWTHYLPDTYIDAKDTVNHWCVGQIVDVDDAKNQVKVHFEGWSNRYDEWIKKNAQRIGPFRRHTEGYTGQKKSAFRENFKISLTHHQFMEKKVQETVKEEFKNFSDPIQVTQFIRGELYFYVDSLISMISVISSEELPMIFIFIQDVFKLIFKWMEIFPQYLQSYQDSIHHPQLFLVNTEAAISMCGNELFDILEKCFGGCIRCSKFFQKFSNEIMPTEGTNEYAARDKIKNNGLLCSFLNAFGNVGGFEKVLNFISFDIKDNKEKLIKGCPFTLTMRVLRAFQSIQDVADRQFVTQLSYSICSALEFRLENLSENEIKELDKDILRGIIEVYKDYMMIIQPQDADKMSELKELQIAQRYLRCPFFEKRVRGINELKEIYNKVANSQSKNRQAGENYTKWLNLEKYSQWIINEKIVQFIFIENPHVELIKRSLEILKLLAFQEQYFSAEIVEMLWVCASEKHEDIIRATLDIIQELAQFMPLDRVQQLSVKLRTLKDSDFDEKLVTFLKQFTINTLKNIRAKQYQLNKSAQSGLKNMISKQKEIKIDDSKYIDLTLFWQIFQDQNKVSQKVKDLALNSLIEILQEINEKDQKDLYTMLAIENIRKCQTFYSSIVFLRKILNTYPQDTMVKTKTSSTPVITISLVLQEIFKKSDLFDLILVNLKNYLKQAHETKLKLGTADKLQSMCLSGFATHEDFIDVVMSFVQFLIVNSKVTLSFTNVEQMFQLLVTRAVTEHESNALFTLITKENEQARSHNRRFLLEDKVRNEVFQKIFCNSKYLNFDKMNIRGFNCFRRLFLIVNEEEKSLEIRKERVYINNLNQLQGLDTLWAIAIQSEVQRVREYCRDFLVDLHLNIKYKTANQKKSINEIFPDRCFKYIKQTTERQDYQLNCLKLIKCYISRFDGDHILEEDQSQYPQNELKQIEVTLSPDKANIVVRIHNSQKLWQLKRKMANAFRMKLSEFYIKTKTGPLEDESYDEQVSEYKIEKIHIQRVNPEEMEKEFPRYIIGYNKDHLNMLLELFKNGKEESRREVLNLLEILPINLDLRIQMRDHIISKMSPSGSEKSLQEWTKLFQWNSQDPAVTCYYLMTLEDLIIPKKDSPIPEVNTQEVQQKNEFAMKLIQNGGFNFLNELFKSLSKTNIEREIIKTKILALLLRFFSHFFKFKPNSIFKQAVTPQLLEIQIQETLLLIENYINGIYNQQVNGTGNDRDVRVLKNEQSIFIYAFLFLSQAFQYNHQLVNTLYQYPNITSTFRLALIELDYIKFIHDYIYNTIIEICIKIDPSPSLQIKPSFFFMKMFLNQFIEHALSQQKGDKTSTFFTLMNEILMRTEVSSDLHQIKPVEIIIHELTQHIFNREIKEISARDEDQQLQGLLSLLKNMLIKFPQVKFEKRNELLKYLIHDCLFNKETRGQLITKARAMPPKCKNSKTREECLMLLNEVCFENEEGIYILIKYLKNHISETFWRTPRRNDWQITVHQQERSLTGFVGLKNIGCICYMNSIMQQLFMIPTFRKAILEVEDSNFGKESNEENVLYQLKMIFGGLMEIERQYFNPKNFCFAFKDIDGSPIDPMIQKDVDEFFNMAMDRVENLVKGKKEDKVIKNLFQGVLANEFICKGCPHYSEREEPFMTISLQVKNKHSIKESLEAFVEGEMLEGDNAYHCEKCEKKVNTLKRCCIKRMPNVMFLVLKRFEFNFDTMTKFKINDYCEFPMQINMKEYCQEALAKKDLIKEMEDKNLTMEDLSEEQRAILDKEIPSKYYDYNLRGTVIHIGTADQGHYISYIQDRESQQSSASRWFEFNDQFVKEFDPSEIPNEAFGGEDESFVNNLNFNQMQGSGLNENQLKNLKTKIKNAYILIYERDEAIDMEKFNEFMDDPNINTNKLEIAQKFEQCRLPKTTSAQIQIPPSIHDQILEKNKKFWLSKFIFNKSYIDSVLNIFQKISIQEDVNYIAARDNELQQKSGYQFEMFKFLTTFFLTTVIRAKERGRSVPYFIQILKQALRKNIALSVWLLESFSIQDVIREFLIDSPIPDMKRFVAGLLKTAMQTVYKFEEESLANYIASIDTGVVEYIKATQQGLVKSHKIIDNIMPSKGDTQTIYSGNCQNLNVITLAHHNEKLPILVIMINAFIHLNVSPHYFKNQVFCGQFYQVFAHFSELGEQSRSYLLKCKTVGRLIDLFFYPEIQGNKDAPQESEKFRVQSLEATVPYFVLDKELYIQSNIEKQDAKISINERKLAQQDALQPQMFLLYTISKLSRSCIYVKDAGLNPLANDKLDFQLDSDELAMICNLEKQGWWQFCDKKVTRNAVADMYAHMSFQNKEFSLMVLTVLNIGLQKSTFDEMKFYERALIKQLLIKDQYQPDRTKKALNNIYEIMKLNVSFYKEMDSLIDLVYKICQRSPFAVDMINKTPQYLQYIQTWCNSNPHFPLNLNKNRVFKAGLISWNNIKNVVINQQICDRVSAYTKDRLAKLVSLISKETPVNEDAADSDDDHYHHDFQVKERVDYTDILGNFHSGSIDFALEEMVKFVSEGNQQINQKSIVQWVGTESDQLATSNSLSGSQKKQMNNFYMSLLKNLQN